MNSSLVNSLKNKLISQPRTEIFVVFGALFVILTVTPLGLAQTVGFVVFGIMVLNTIAAGVFQLRAEES